MHRNVSNLWPLVALLSGCASMPDLTVSYYLPKSELAVTVTQTAGCSSGGVPIVKTVVAFSPTYSRGERKSFALKTLGYGAAKADATFEFYGDGRLKSVNTAQSGQVGEVVRSVLSLADRVSLNFDVQGAKQACDELKALVGAKKTLTIVHQGNTDFSEVGMSVQIELKQKIIDQDTMKSLLPIFGSVEASYDLEPGDVNSQPILGVYDGPALTLVEPAEAELAVTITRNNDAATERATTWVPQKGREYRLPMQTSPWFGENKFGVVLSEAGRMTKLRYSGGGEAAGTLASLAESAESLETATAKEKMEQVRAEADLIFQQQRLVACQIDPSNCQK